MFILPIKPVLTEMEAAQKAAEEAKTTAEAAGVTRTASTDEEANSAPETEKEKPTPTPDYAAGLVPSNPPPTPAPATPAPTLTSLTPLKEAPVTRVVMAPSVRPAAPAAVSAAPASAPAQVVRLITAQAATGTGTLATPTVYRLVQPAVASGQPATIVPITTTGTQPVAPKKSVALMLTVRQSVNLRVIFIRFIVPL